MPPTERTPTLPYFPLLVFLFVAGPCLAADYQIEGNIRYGQYAETVLDIVQTRAPALKNRPGVIVIHGAGADKDSVREGLAIPFVDHDFVAADVEYRKDAAGDDVVDAAKWFHNHAAQYKVDTNQIVVAGESAGAELAIKLAVASGIRIAAIIAIDGPNEAPKTPPTLSVQGAPDFNAIFKWLRKRHIP